MDQELGYSSVSIAENEAIKYKNKIREFSKLIALHQKKETCPVKDVLAPAVDKWSLFVMYSLAYGKVLRFSELKAYIPNISARMLTVTLRRLEKSMIIERKVFAQVPPKVEYKLTPFGFKFSEKLIDLNLWLIKSMPA